MQECWCKSNLKRSETSVASSVEAFIKSKTEMCEISKCSVWLCSMCIAHFNVQCFTEFVREPVMEVPIHDCPHNGLGEIIQKDVSIDTRSSLIYLELFILWNAIKINFLPYKILPKIKQQFLQCFKSEFSYKNWKVHENPQNIKYSFLPDKTKNQNLLP